MRDQARDSRRLTALVLREMARNNPVKVRIGDSAIPVSGLLEDAQVIGSILKIGLFSVGAQPFSDMSHESISSRRRGEPMENVPAGLIGLAFAYALRVVRDGADKGEILRDARRIEAVFGPVPLDPMLMSEIAMLAKEGH